MATRGCTSSAARSVPAVLRVPWAVMQGTTASSRWRDRVKSVLIWRPLTLLFAKHLTLG